MKTTQDIHIHTRLSNCGKQEAIAADYIAAAADIGLDTVGFTDHMWDSAVPGAPKWYENQNVEHVLSIREELAEIRTDIRVLVGCECEFCREGRDVAITEEAAKRFDYILAPNSHTHMTLGDERENREAHAYFMMQTFYDIIESKNAKYITSVAHPFNAVCCPYPVEELYRFYSDEDFYKCFSKAAKVGISMELNPCHIADAGEGDEGLKRLEQCRMMTIAKEAGCRFTYGGDRHTAVNYTVNRRMERFAELCGIGDGDMRLL